MDLLITIAKVILALLPFLNRKSKIKGEWIASYKKYESDAEMQERVEANQLWSLVWGKIYPLNNLLDPSWKFYGLIRDQVLVGLYLAEEKLQHWQGSFTLKLGNTEKELSGVYSGFEEETQNIVGSSYTWTKK